MKIVYLAAVSYLLGSIPFAYIFSRLFKGIDIRRVGSRNVGTTNVLKSIGFLPAVLTGVGDCGKGALAVLLARLTYADLATAPLVALLFAIIGHNWPIWLNFEGGGGLATCIGGMMFISMVTMFWMAVVFVALWIVTRHKYMITVSACAAFPFIIGICERSWDSFTLGLGMGMALGIKQVRAWFEFAKSKIEGVGG